MKLGICMETAGFRAAIVSGDMANPKLVARHRFTNPDVGDASLTANWFHSHLISLLSDGTIDAIAAKIHYQTLNQQSMIAHGLPLGVLALVAHQRAIPLLLLTKQKLKSAITFNLAKGTKPHLWIDALKDTLPAWDDAARDAILAGVASP